jgi:hypothetical protein
MKFKCGHESFAGVGDVCMACHKAGIKLDRETPKKQRNQSGRPKWKSDEDKEATRRARYNRRNERDRLKRKLKPIVIGSFVAYKDGKWRCIDRHIGYSSFDMAKVYTSLAFANRFGGGVVMELMETEHKTIANHKAKEIRNEHK